MYVYNNRKGLKSQKQLQCKFKINTFGLHKGCPKIMEGERPEQKFTLLFSNRLIVLDTLHPRL